ncbi:hypothetical protein ACEPAH_9272 [Sanghuangporus vaninii]
MNVVSRFDVLQGCYSQLASTALSARTDVEPVDPSLSAPFVSELHLAQCFGVVNVTALVYDAVISIDKEITGAPFSILKTAQKVPRKTVNFVYFVNRYAGIFGAAPRLYHILVIRILALYSQDAKLSIILKTYLALDAAFKLGLDIYLVLLEHQFAKDMTLCIVDAIPQWQWMVPMVNATLLMILALYEVAEFWRTLACFKGFTQACEAGKSCSNCEAAKNADGAPPITTSFICGTMVVVR